MGLHRSALLIHVAACALLAVNAAAMPTAMPAVSGFVTTLVSSSRFSMGTLQVDLSPSARCSETAFITKHYWYNLLLAPDLFTTGGASREYRPHASFSEVACSQLNLAVGSWVRINGDLSAHGQLIARTLVVFRWSNSRDTDRGGAVLEEQPTRNKGRNEIVGTIWLDGYPISIGSQSAVSERLDVSQFSIKRRGAYEFYLKAPASMGTTREIGPTQLSPGQCVDYRRPTAGDGQLVTGRLSAWECENDPGLGKFVRRNSEQSLTAPRLAPRREDGKVNFYPSPPPLRRHRYLEILPDKNIQDFVSQLGVSILPSFAKTGAGRLPEGVNFRFVVVRSLKKEPSAWHILDDPTDAHPYHEIIRPLPDGLILIAVDGGIARLRSSAELALLLSMAVTSVIQQQEFLADRTAGGISYGPPDVDALRAWQDAQALRIGIRQLYLAGYDIREAPFAWLVASGKSVPNPVIGGEDPGSNVPWYSSYAFDYISRYYSDVDYSKLKRGEKEYAQFLDELRKADPEAFAKQK